MFIKNWLGAAPDLNAFAFNRKPNYLRVDPLEQVQHCTWPKRALDRWPRFAKAFKLTTVF